MCTGKKWRGFLAANGVGKSSPHIRDYNLHFSRGCVYDKIQRSKGHDVNNNVQPKNIGWKTLPRFMIPCAKPEKFRTQILLNQRRRNRDMVAMTSITATIYTGHISCMDCS